LGVDKIPLLERAGISCIEVVQLPGKGGRNRGLAGYWNTEESGNRENYRLVRTQPLPPTLRVKYLVS